MLKTDYNNTKGIVLPFPYNFTDKEYHQLSNFFIELYRLIPKEIELNVICNSDEAITELKSKTNDLSINIILIEGFEEIWLRDILGLKSDKEVFLPQYKPDYFTKTYTHDYINQLRDQVCQIHTSLGNEVVDLEVVLDGGNFVTNGEIAFMTDKVINDNPGLNVKEYFIEKLGITPFLIEQSEYDKLGHSDGTISFLEKHTVALSQYQKELTSLAEEQKQQQDLKEELEYQRFKVVEVYDRPVDEKVGNKDDFLYGARGIYINNILLNDTVILPQYNLPKYKATKDYNSLNKTIYEDLGYKVKTIQADLLGKQGGVLHCVSWCY
jgi:agmatine/peptidylarginine deiminase